MTEPNTYDIGDDVDLEGDFTDPSGSAVDPATVTCTVLAPDGTTTTPSTTRSATGKYAAACSPDQHGIWWYAFDGTGAAQASGEKYFVVRRREIPR